MNALKQAIAAIEDCIDSLEYVNNAHPDVTGSGVRRERVVKATTALTALRQHQAEGWRSIETAPPEMGVEVLALIRGCDTGRLKRVVLERVNESDCTWRFDGEELSWAWDIIAWQTLPALPPEPNQPE